MMKLALLVALAPCLVARAQDLSGYAAPPGDWDTQGAPVAGATALSASDLLPAQDVQSADISAAESTRRRRRRYKKKHRNKEPREPLYDNDEDYYYDRDDSYGSPKAPSSGYDAPSPSYNPPAPSYSPPSYNPPSYSPPHDGYGAPSYDSGGGDDSFNDFLNALATFLPIGLFLAAIPPNIITINTSTGRKKRDMNAIDSDENDFTYTFPFLDEVTQMGYANMKEPQCQKKLFCKMAVFGGYNEDANRVQKFFYQASTMIPAFLTRSIGLEDMLGAVQNGHCDSFQCPY